MITPTEEARALANEAGLRDVTDYTLRCLVRLIAAVRFEALGQASRNQQNDELRQQIIKCSKNWRVG